MVKKQNQFFGTVLIKCCHLMIEMGDMFRVNNKLQLLLITSFSKHYLKGSICYVICYMYVCNFNDCTLQNQKTRIYAQRLWRVEFTYFRKCCASRQKSRDKIAFTPVHRVMCVGMYVRMYIYAGTSKLCHTIRFLRSDHTEPRKQLVLGINSQLFVCKLTQLFDIYQ